MLYLATMSKQIPTLLPILTLSLLTIPTKTWAHEAYVLEKEAFWTELSKPWSAHALSALQNPHNLAITTYITIGVLTLLTCNFLFRRSKAGKAFHTWIESYSHIGPIFVRIAIASALFFSAISNSFLGPELSLNAFQFPTLVRLALGAISIMIIFGIFTEISALLGLAIYITAFKTFGAYVLTYTNYLGELLVLALFGMRQWSIDTLVLGKLKGIRKKYEKYETTIVRILYGFGLIYAGITVKFLHPDLTLKVATDWNLAQFPWLFPSDPLLTTFGAGLAETAIGLFIILGFELRLTVLISLFYITMSLFFFQELVWPHYLLYGISLSLLVQPETFTLDHLLFSKRNKKIKWWHRPFLAHHPHGKSQKHPK